MIWRSFIKWIQLGFLAAVITACGGDSEDTDAGGDLADIYAYKADSPYAGILEPCLRASRAREYCQLDSLPILGMEYDSLTVEDIMYRVAVSHDWMGARFETLLSEMPEAMLPLFRGVTGIVISHKIRPAYYTAGTGAIYLDPAFFWLSIEEKRTIDPKQDFRSGFDDPLAFRQLNRYLKDGRYAHGSASPDSLSDNSTRTLDDIRLLVARVLLHELAHANDFLPPSSHGTLDGQFTVSDAANRMSDDWISSQLSDNTPLESDTMFSLAGVMYAGDDPSASDLEISAVEVGLEFEPDGAGDDYGYSSQYEDLAMLFETSMMKYFFDADFELAFTSVPENPSACNDYDIGWGVRNRIGDDKVKARAEFAATMLLPDLELSEFFEGLESPTEISGDWCLATEQTGSGKLSPVQYGISSLRPYL